MSSWVRALLDPAEINQNSGTQDTIRAPPRFEIPAIDSAVFAPPETRGRTRRSASPSKSLSAARKIATPRKSRQTRAQKESSVTSSASASTSLQSSLDAAAAAVPESPLKGKKSKSKPETNGEKSESEDEDEDKDEAEGESEVQAEEEAEEDAGEDEHTIPVKKSNDHVSVNIESTVDSVGDLEKSKTNVSVDIPSELPDLPAPEDTEEMIAKAKAMVEEATKLQGEEEPAPKKRKAQSSVEDTPAQPTKRTKVLEDRLRRERVRNRALIGVTATLAAAAAIPYFF